MGQRTVAIVLAIVGLNATADVLLAARATPPRAAAAAPPSEWRAPDFAYPDQDGHTITRAQLDGHVWIADFIFTECRAACPMLTARMVLLQRQLAGSDVRFVSFSVDPAHDTPAVLKRYAAQWHADESRWRLLATDAKTLPATAAGMRMLVAATGNAAEPLVHSDRFVLVDSHGQVRGVFDSADDEERRQLVAEARRLSTPKTPEVAIGAAAPRAPASGAALFAALGCAGCHDRPEVAAPLGGLFGRSVTLADGTRVVANEDYLRESILAPSAHLVAGYGPTMPSYAGQLTNAQLDAVVAYLKAPGRYQAAAVQRVVDPVCKMEVSASAGDLSVERDGHRYWFCSDRCRRRFLQRPDDAL